MNPHSEAVLMPFIDEGDIKQRVEDLVKEITTDLGGDELIVIGVLKGSFMFLADLVRRLHRHDFPILIDFLQVSSYGSKTVSSGQISMTHDIATDISGRRVLLVDDILDTGRTSRFLKDFLQKRNPSVLKTCVFLDKPKRRAVSFEADYVGFRVPDAFVVGYGLDYDNRYREMPSLSLIRFADGNPPPSFGFHILNHVVYLEGRLDAAGAEHIHETLLHWKGNLYLNLKRLVFIDPTGIGMLQKAAEEIQRSGHELKFSGCSAKMAMELKSKGFENGFRI
jgi:hypoxanthine phosphoribosyltransferase